VKRGGGSKLTCTWGGSAGWEGVRTADLIREKRRPTKWVEAGVCSDVGSAEGAVSTAGSAGVGSAVGGAETGAAETGGAASAAGSDIMRGDLGERMMIKKEKVELRMGG
jgi:hypothetical protein